MPSHPRHGDPALLHVLTATIGVAGLARLTGLEKDHLGQPLVGVDLCRERSGVGNLKGDMPLPLRFEGGHIHDDAAACVGRLADADGEDVTGNAEVLDATCKGEGIGRDDADIGLDIDERLLIELLGIDHRAVDVGEDLELIRHPEVISVAGESVTDDTPVIGGTDLAFNEGFDHPVFQGHFTDPVIRTDGHNPIIEAEERSLRKVNFTDPWRGDA